ncbi:MAG TPA: phosphatidylglycerophosphatase A [Rickettsiales bacterium]|nr:phosphatidylglycerophosphatase A [Rickettsiales bacterium]
MSGPLPLSHPAKLLGTWFGAGLSPKAPGTCGSIAALPFAWLIQVYFGNTGLFAAASSAFMVGWWVCHVYLKHTDTKDPQEMVIDEVSGQWLLLSFMPHTVIAYAVGLALFRFFDALKPWPIRVADRKIGGGFGVMFDDILAALYPLAIFFIIQQAGYGDRILQLIER